MSRTFYNLSVDISWIPAIPETNTFSEPDTSRLGCSKVLLICRCRSSANSSSPVSFSSAISLPLGSSVDITLRRAREMSLAAHMDASTVEHSCLPDPK